MQAAARIFFDKPASQLNLQQSALLAGLPQAPSQYNPFGAPSEARRRRNEVLSKMAELHYISDGQASAAKAAPLEVERGNFYSQRREDFFFEYVRELLDHRYGRQTVAQGGLKVYTTIDLNMQRLARKAIAEVLNEPEDPASAIVTHQPRQRRHRGDGRVGELREVPVQPRRRRPSPAGIDVQGDRPRRRALAGCRPEQHHTTTRTRSPRAGCPAIRHTK